MTQPFNGITFPGRKSYIAVPGSIDPNKPLYDEGFLFLSKESYGSSDSATTCSVFRELYDTLPPDPYDGCRARAHIKLRLDTLTGALTVALEQAYSQTEQSNYNDGGKVRIFARISDEILDSFIFQNRVTDNLNTMLNLFTLNKDVVTIGIHMVRYLAKANVPGHLPPASQSSPNWLHRDDEPLVFLTVLNKSRNMVGGDSVIALEKNQIKYTFSLSPLEGVLLTKGCWHAVTPMAAQPGEGDAYRDILLVTLEEDDSVISIKKPSSVENSQPASEIAAQESS